MRNESCFWSQLATLTNWRPAEKMELLRLRDTREVLVLEITMKYSNLFDTGDQNLKSYFAFRICMIEPSESFLNPAFVHVEDKSCADVSQS